jgi:hypothetical protein
VRVCLDNMLIGDLGWAVHRCGYLTESSKARMVHILVDDVQAEWTDFERENLIMDFEEDKKLVARFAKRYGCDLICTILADIGHPRFDIQHEKK